MTSKTKLLRSFSSLESLGSLERLALAGAGAAASAARPDANAGKGGRK